MRTDPGIIARPEESARKMKRLMLLRRTLEVNGVKPRAYRFPALFLSIFFPPIAVKCLPVPYSLGKRQIRKWADSESGNTSGLVRTHEAQKRRCGL